MKFFIFVLLFVLSIFASDEEVVLKALIMTVKHDLSQQHIKFISLKTFPTCKTCSDLLPCCPDLSKYRTGETSNDIYLKEKDDAFIGVKFQKDSNTYYVVYEYKFKYENSEFHWEMVNEVMRIIINNVGEIIQGLDYE